MMRNIIYVICCMFLISCRKEANIKLPEVKPKPTVFCYLNPTDTLIKLKLTMSQPLYNSKSGSYSNPVTDANVVISGNSISKQLNFNSTTGYYELKSVHLPIQAGQTYFLQINLANGTVITSSTTVPASTVNINTVTISNASSQELPDQLKIGFKDDPLFTNYYALTFTYIEKYLTDTAFVDYGVIPTLYNDMNINGSTIELYASNLTYNTNLIGYDFYLNNVSIEYFQFYKSILRSAGDNPFSEPALIYTNVKGGFGVFASYTYSYVRKFK